jgi:hypothetical protein
MKTIVRPTPRRLRRSKERVEGSSPSEGFTERPCKRVSFFSELRTSQAAGLSADDLEIDTEIQ